MQDAFDKIQTPYLIKTLSKLLELPHPKKKSLKKPTANIILMLPSYMENEARMFTLHISVQYCTKGSNQWNNVRKRNKRHTYGVKLSLFIYNRIVYVGNPKAFTKKKKKIYQNQEAHLVRLKNTRYTKSIVCLFTSN